MAAPHQTSTSFAAPAQQIFQTALGLIQQRKSMEILAVHNEGRKLVVIEKSMMSNRKIYVIGVADQGNQAVLHLSVVADPRMRGALLDGVLNKKAAEKYVAAVQSTLATGAPAQATPVPNHYVQKKNQVPWEDPNTEPDIQLGFSWLGLASFT